MARNRRVQLTLGLGLEERPEPNRERPQSVRCAARQERAAGPCGDRGEGRERADGDEHGGERGHDLWVLVCDELERLACVDEP